MKRRKDWRSEAAWYQRLCAALVHKIGGEGVTLTEEDLKQAVEKGIQVAHNNGTISMRVPPQHQSRILVPR